MNICTVFRKFDCQVFAYCNVIHLVIRHSFELYVVDDYYRMGQAFNQYKKYSVGTVGELYFKDKFNRGIQTHSTIIG